MAARHEAPAPSRLQSELARRILRLLKEQNAAPGHHLVELDLCRMFSVSRTPVRGALKLLADEGVVAPRAGRGFVLAKEVTEPPEDSAGEDEEDESLFTRLADARAKGLLPDQVTQQELVRRFDARLASVMRVLHMLSGLGLVERKPGNGWAFSTDSTRALNESYALRRALEPQMLLQPGFRLDRAWAEKTRDTHMKLRRKQWRAGDGTDFHHINADFHEQLARCSGNRAMLRAVQQQNLLRRFLSSQWNYPMEQVYSAIDDHMEILAALEAGYNDKASALMLHHLTQSATQTQKEEAA
ncbi:MAG TPA: GntR family transcriptional regulator [Rhizomicrobium sp.]|jgi:DNA-binding GntR family transcriptional regulator|nr:GntR family transcriptional regulator [Rhizomicrobium sp.]